MTLGVQRPALIVLGLEIGLKKVNTVCFTDADTLVSYFDPELKVIIIGFFITKTEVDFNSDCFVSLRKLLRVLDQVYENLLHPKFIHE